MAVPKDLKAGVALLRGLNCNTRKRRTDRPADT